MVLVPAVGDVGPCSFQDPEVVVASVKVEVILTSRWHDMVDGVEEMIGWWIIQIYLILFCLGVLIYRIHV